MLLYTRVATESFQFLGIPPKGERMIFEPPTWVEYASFQFLGIPPKGEQTKACLVNGQHFLFPISRDPPEGGTSSVATSQGEN